MNLATASYVLGQPGRVMIVEDDRLVALDLEIMLVDFGLVHCATAHSAEEALARARSTSPDLVLMDIFLEGETDGVQAAEQLREELGLRVVYLTGNSDLSTVQRAKQTEPYGYVLKPVRALDLRCCLELAMHQVRLSRAQRASGLAESAGPAEEAEGAFAQNVHPAELEALSAREREVLVLVARGFTGKDIAQRLGIAKPTVDTYRARLNDKLGTRSRAELVTLAVRAGWLNMRSLE